MPLTAEAQTTTAPAFKGATNNNPLSASVFCADPTALEYDGRLYYGFGANTDIVTASVEAYIDCINKFKQ